MEKSEIVLQLKNFMEAEFPNQGMMLTETTNLSEEWFIDSLGIIETVIFIENNFRVEVSRADINGSNFKSIATLSHYVAERLDQLHHKC